MNCLRISYRRTITRPMISANPAMTRKRSLQPAHAALCARRPGPCDGKAGNLPVYYTEWCTSSNPRDRLHDDPYAAAFIVKTVLEANGLVQGYSYWTFSDIFEENYFPSLPFHGGFGLLTSMAYQTRL